MINVIAYIEVKEECIREFTEIFKTIVPDVLNEKGCVYYRPTQDYDAGLEKQTMQICGITVVDRWESFDELKAHFTAPHMLVYKAKVKDMVVGQKLTITEDI